MKNQNQTTTKSFSLINHWSHTVLNIVLIFSLHFSAMAYIPFTVTREAMLAKELMKGSLPECVFKAFADEYAIIIKVLKKKGSYIITYDKTASDSIYDALNKRSKTSGLLVSETARNAWIKELDPERKSAGALIFDYNVYNCTIFDSSKIELFSSFIDIKEVKADLTYENVNYGEIEKRTISFARILEHDFLGHAVRRLNDNIDTVFDSTCPGEAAEFANIFLKEMGLPERWNYSIHNKVADEATIIFMSKQKKFPVVFQKIDSKHEPKVHSWSINSF